MGDFNWISPSVQTYVYLLCIVGGNGAATAVTVILLMLLNGPSMGSCQLFFCIHFFICPSFISHVSIGIFFFFFVVFSVFDKFIFCWNILNPTWINITLLAWNQKKKKKLQNTSHTPPPAIYTKKQKIKFPLWTETASREHTFRVQMPCKQANRQARTLTLMYNIFESLIL